MKHKNLLVVVAGLVMGLSVASVEAQEAVTSAPKPRNMDWNALVRLVDKLETDYGQMQQNLEAINRCGARGLFYVPGYAADPHNCKAA